MKITPGFGPASTPQAVDLGEAPLRVLTALREVVDDPARASGSAGAVTVLALAQALDAHPNGVRRHLEALIAEGYVEAHSAPGGTPGLTSGAPGAAAPGAAAARGRPSLRYDVTLRGRAALAGAAAPLSGDYLAMTSAFAAHLAVTSSDPVTDAHGIGRAWGRDLARRIDVRDERGDRADEPARQRVLGLLDALGFSPQQRPDGTVALRTCPLLEAAHANPDVLCQVHLGLVQGASAHYGGPGEGGHLQPFAEPGACTLRLP